MSHYRHLMNQEEKRAYSHLTGTMKATRGRSDVRAQEETRNHSQFSRWLTDDPAALQLAREGWSVFLDRTANRIFAEHSEDIFMNFCPRCNELARTPKAQQCRSCHYDWHASKSDPRKD
jgi:ribosomal protein L40E